MAGPKEFTGTQTKAVESCASCTSTLQKNWLQGNTQLPPTKSVEMLLMPNCKRRLYSAGNLSGAVSNARHGT